MALSDQHMRFIDLYFEHDFNGSKAARECGFHERYSWELLRKHEIREEIDRRLAERRARSKLTIEHVENLLRNIAEVEPLDIWDENGDLRPLNEMAPHARRAIKSIKTTTKEHYITGEQERVVQIELWDKKGAIELLGKYKKMFTEKVELDANVAQRVIFTVKGVGE